MEILSSECFEFNVQVAYRLKLTHPVSFPPFQLEDLDSATPYVFALNEFYDVFIDARHSHDDAHIFIYLNG